MAKRLESQRLLVRSIRPLRGSCQTKPIFGRRSIGNSATLAESSSSSTWGLLGDGLQLYTDVFLSLPSLLPLGPTVDPWAYSTCIVVLTLSLRLGITFPVTLWQRLRIDRLRYLVSPDLRAHERQTLPLVIARCRKAGKTESEFKREMGNEVPYTNEHLRLFPDVCSP